MAFLPSRKTFHFALFWAIFASHHIGTKAQLPCIDNLGSSHKNRTVVFEVTSTMNLTKHWTTKFAFKNESPKLPNNWKVRVEQSVDSYGGRERFYLKGVLVVPPQVPSTYELFPGIGYYKRYEKVPGGWDEAYTTCANDGAHLAIINSEAEFNVIRSLSKQDSPYLGFHDRVKEGEWITIFGEPLATTGYVPWLPKQPDNSGGKENCGCMWNPGGGLNDVNCNTQLPFICEFDLSWSE